MPPAAETLDRVKAATVFVRSRFGKTFYSGSGFFVNTPGYIVTTARVVSHPSRKSELAEEVQVGIAHGTSAQRMVKAKVVGINAESDLALLKVKDDNLPTPLQFGKAANLAEVTEVHLFGIPLSELLGENAIFNTAKVSGIQKKGAEIAAIQFASGSFSIGGGGPVTSNAGEVVGVCQGGTGSTQISTAIPAEVATAFVAEQIKAGGSIPSPKSEPRDRDSRPQRERDPYDPRQYDGPVEGPPEEEFWEKYNSRLEFPLGTVGAVFAHVLVVVVLVFGIYRLMNDDAAHANPNLQLMSLGGMDDLGEGMVDGGGKDGAADRELNGDPFAAAKEEFRTPQQLADAKEKINKFVLDDPNGNIPIAAPNAQAYKDLNVTIAQKLLGRQKGSGTGPKAGAEGTGADSTRERGLRWVLRFRITSGRDYLDQLKAMNAEILIPLPPDGSKCLIIRDLNNPQPVVANDQDLARLAGKIQFSDNRPKPVREVLDVLGADPSGVKSFWAFFPKDIEEELARKEKGYRNRRPEDIEETIFLVTVRGGAFEIVVDDQVAKK